MGRVYTNAGIRLPGVTKNVYSNLSGGKGVDKGKNIRLRYVMPNNVAYILVL